MSFYDRGSTVIVMASGAATLAALCTQNLLVVIVCGLIGALFGLWSGRRK